MASEARLFHLARERKTTAVGVTNGGFQMFIVIDVLVGRSLWYGVYFGDGVGHQSGGNLLFWREAFGYSRIPKNGREGRPKYD